MNQAKLHSLRLSIDGMTCEGCVQAVRRALGRIPGVEGLEVGLGEGRSGWARLEVAALPDHATLAAAIEEAGFELRAVSPAAPE